MISVVIPLYNRADLVGETLDSVLAQSYSEWECIVVDDRSTDASADVVRSYMEKDNRFRLLIRPEDRIKGGPTCRNIGLENARGDLLFFLDSDDVLTPLFFETVVGNMEKNPNADFALLPCDKFTESIDHPFTFLNSNLEGSSVYDIIFRKFIVSVMSYVWRARLIRENQITWTEGLPRSQDTDFAFKCVAASNDGVVIKLEPMNHVREHKGNITNQSFHDPGIALIMFGVFVESYRRLDGNGKMTPSNKELFFSGLVAKIYHIGILYGNRKVIGDACRFMRENGGDLDNLRALQRKLNTLWWLLPVIKPFRSFLLKAKTGSFSRWLYKLGR